MSFTNKFVKVYKALLPSPFTIAIVLSFLAFILALLFGKETPGEFKPLTVLKYWENGLWNNNLIVFAMQMMLMLVLGHVLALSKPVNHFINSVVVHLKNTSEAASVVAFLTMSVALFNWGLGLIFGAILARKVAEQALKNNWKINYPLIGAAGYSGLMVWHGGFSGSSLAKVAEPGHLDSLFPTASFTNELPQAITYSETVFSSLNIFVSILLLLVIPIALFFLGKKSPVTSIQLNSHFEVNSIPMISGAEKLDHSKILGFSFGSILFVYVLYKIFWITGFDHFFTPNNINLLLLSLGILFHGDFYKFLKAIDEAISGASGILIQFPLYFGIMGIVRDSELISMFSNYISSISGPTSFTFFTFFSAGIVNILVPSGGGQWAIQGPLLIQTAHDIGAPYAKNILAFAYGDQLTNMLQPFWALPLLGITNLKAKQILPYSLFLFIIGLIIFAAGLLIF